MDGQGVGMHGAGRHVSQAMGWAEVVLGPESDMGWVWIWGYSGGLCRDRWGPGELHWGCRQAWAQGQTVWMRQ